jgi:Arc/MetJ-type ribon-helix-helix transcriptional regulator
MKTNDWRDELPLSLEDFVDSFVVKGAKYKDVCDAIKAEIENLQAAHERDPDPADEDVETVEEPANDWPAAD